MQIVMKKLTDLQPFERNAKEHSEQQIAKIAESILQYGFLVPLVISAEGVIVSGHGRYLAAETLKRKEVPCVIADNLTEEQMRGFRIADNKVAESGWEVEKLKIELEELQLAEIFTGFSPAEIDILLNPVEIKTDDSRGSGTAVISFTIVFDDVEQQEQWFGFIKQLKLDYPTEDTTAAKIIAFLNTHADV